MIEDIAIVGLGCRLPGQCSSPSKLWDFIIAGRSAYSEVPSNRWNAASWYHPDPSQTGGISSTGGYFLSHDDHFKSFEPAFFGISALEALSMDPQQRKLLEVVYETFESAGVTLQQMAGSQTACYIGAFTGDHHKTLVRDTEQYIPYEATGSDMTILSNRINYVFDLKGPSLTVDTACSSSLYALHLACQSLQLGDCDGAIVGGTNILMDIGQQMTATKLGILSPTSTCHTFDSKADGFGRSDGVSVIYIKRISDAIRDKDPIRAIIRATSVNTNGRGHGINHPGVLGQEAVIRKAYSKANLDLKDTAFIECHGTGTPVGDPIEVASIGNVFVEGRSTDHPLWLTALKSNIGHTEGASGVASIIKLVLSLEAGLIPSVAGFQNINPAIDLKGGRLQIVKENQTWPADLPYRRASANSFGYGGANAHVILDAASSYLEAIGISSPRNLTANHMELPWKASKVNRTNGIDMDAKPGGKGGQEYIIITSAFSVPSLESNIRHLAASRPNLLIQDLVHTLTRRRTQFQHRAFAIVPQSAPVQVPDLEHWTNGLQADNTLSVAFIFTGQGAQWPQMGIKLLNRFAVVSQTLFRLQRALATIIPGLDWSLVSALTEPAESSRIGEIAVSLTLCTALQIALVDLLRSWGINPLVVTGHSSGEAAAAYAAGFLTAEEAVITSYYRGFAMQQRAKPGAMMAVGLGGREVLPYLRSHPDVHLACHNSPQSVTLSGSEEQLDKLATTFKDQSIFQRKIKSSGFANHSPFVAKAAAYFRNTYSDALPSTEAMASRISTCAMYSCITGGQVSAQDVGIHYWGDNIEAPVLFDEAVQAMLRIETQVDCLIEIGPHSALAGPLKQIQKVAGTTHTYLPSLQRGSDDVSCMLKLAGHLFNLGCNIDVSKVNETEEMSQLSLPRLIVDLEPYQWNYDREYWFENRMSAAWRFRKHPRHELLGSREPNSSDSAPSWRNTLTLKELPWIADHKIGGSIILPAACYVSIVIEALRQLADATSTTEKAFRLEKLVIKKAMTMSSDEDVEIVLSMYETIQRSAQSRDRSFHVEVSSVRSTSWVRHATGTATILTDVEQSQKDYPQGDYSAATVEGDQQWYQRLAQLGLNYGPAFQPLHNIQIHSREEVAEADLDLQSASDAKASPYLFHPAPLDGALQLAFISGTSKTTSETVKTYLPSEFISLTIRNSETEEVHSRFVQVKSRTQSHNVDRITSSFKISDHDHGVLVEAQVVFVAFAGATGDGAVSFEPQMYQKLIWQPDIDKLQGKLSLSQITSLARAHTLGLLESHDDLQDDQHKKEHPVSTPLCSLLKLILHKDPGLRVACICDDAEILKAILTATGALAVFPAYHRFLCLATSSSTLGSAKMAAAGAHLCDILLLEEVVQPGEQEHAEGDFDLLIVALSGESGRLSVLRPQLESMLKHSRQHVVVNLTEGSLADIVRAMTLLGVKEPVLTISDSIAMSCGRTGDKPADLANQPDPSRGNLCIVYRQPSKPLLALSQAFECETIYLSRVHKDLARGAKVVLLLEKEVLATADNDILKSIQHLFRFCSSLIWITGFDTMSSCNPTMSLARGMAKVVMAEHSALQLFTIDVARIGDVPTLTSALTTKLGHILYQNKTQEATEFDFVLDRRGVWYIPRYVVDEIANSNDRQLISHSPASTLSQFDEHAAYLLIGCLGGLGRSIVTWMQARGARHFIFLSRSGKDNPATSTFLENLSNDIADGSVTVIRGDVTSHNDVERAVASATYPIKGVIQAAGIFERTAFSAMTEATWHKVIDAKVKGTMNLHNATKDLSLPLDYFVMLSSTLGVLGPVTQSAYAAANAFLDDFAQYRRTSGLQATSLSLGMVTEIGHLQESPEIAQALQNWGSYDISEAEFLRMMDLACRPHDVPGGNESASQGSAQDTIGPLIVTGLDPVRLASTISATSPPAWTSHAALRHIKHAVNLVRSSVGTSHLENSASQPDDKLSTLRLQDLLAKPATSETNKEISELVKSVMITKFAHLTHDAPEKTAAVLGRTLSDLGMDSILASDLHRWMVKELRVEVELMLILEGRMTLRGLIELVVEQVKAQIST